MPFGKNYLSYDPIVCANFSERIELVNSDPRWNDLAFQPIKVQMDVFSVNFLAMKNVMLKVKNLKKIVFFSSKILLFSRISI